MSRLPASLPPILATACLIAATGLAASGLVGCSKSDAGAKAKGGGKRGGGFGMQMPPMPVEVADVAPGVMRDRFRAVGSIEAVEVVDVASEVNAVVRALPFREGQGVARGQLLAQLDDADVRAEVARSRALAVQADVARRRAEDLRAKGAIPAQTADEAIAASAVARANLQAAEVRLAKTRIRAPFAGVIGRRRVSPGAYLRAGDVIARLARLDRVKIAFTAPERYAATLRAGVPVAITTPAFPGQTFTGHITVVDPIVDQATRVVELVAELPNPTHRLRAGMSADVAATLGERATALTVPDEAVFAEGDQAFVYVVHGDSTVSRAPIRIATRDSSRVEVAEGLAAGDRVVRAGYQKLFEGAHVLPVVAR